MISTAHIPAAEAAVPFPSGHRLGEPASCRSLLDELLILCARIGFNP